MMVFIKRYCKKIKFILPLLIAMSFMNIVHAEDIGVVRARAIIGSQGQILVSSRFNIVLPLQLEDALKQGVSLNFKLAFNLDGPTYTAYKLKISNWFSEAASISYKISYHPLTDRYRLSIGSLSTDHKTLKSALESIGGIANWQALPKGALKTVDVNDVKASIRLSLTMDDLPKPFQINGITAKKWNLDTGWVNLAISREKE